MSHEIISIVEILFEVCVCNFILFVIMFNIGEYFSESFIQTS